MPPDELGTLFTRAVARGVGYSDSQIRRRIGSGRWIVVVGHVFAPAGVELTPRLRDRAAVMAVPDAVLSGPSAARWHGIELPDQRTWITVPPGRRIRLSGVELRREELAETDVVRHSEDLAMTTVGRTVFDCVRALPLDRAERLLLRALDERWVSYEGFLQRVHAHTGRHGMAHLVTLVSRLAHARRVDPVKVIAGRLTAAGISGWSTRQPFHGQIVDLVFHRPRLAIDCGGGAWHNGLVRAGWTVLRYSPAEVLEHTDDVLAELLSVRDQLLSARRRT
ncbi:MAG TPA: hypothetical protein VFC19_50440 [Candidatus Limnocylindrales bacterium]|nr:hypothetical protein [Candidatus Limnocylindrales bacterium]